LPSSSSFNDSYQMKQVLLSGSGNIEVVDVPVPALMRGSVLVRNAYSLISTGTEAAAVTGKSGIAGLIQKATASHGRMAQAWEMAKTNGIAATVDAIQRKLGEYVAIGYSSAGQVVEADDAPFERGEFVACMGGDFATHSEYVVVPSNLVAVIPKGVNLEHAAFGALGSIAMHGIRRLELTPGESVGVLGLGLVGQITVQLLSAMGFRPVGLDLVSSRIYLARSISSIDAWSVADVDNVGRVQELTKGYGLDGVVVCAATKSDDAINLAFDLCRRGGRVSLVGDVGLGLDRAKMYQKEIELRLSCSYGPGRYDPNYEISGRDYPLRFVRWTEKRNLEYFLELLCREQVQLEPLITARYPIADAAAAYARVKADAQNTLAVLISHGDIGTSGMRPSRDAYAVVTSKRASPPQGTRIRLGIIGAGKFTGAVQLPNIKRLPVDYEVGVIASRAGSTSTVLARRFGIPVSTTDPKVILEDPSIDAVMICTRHSTHAQLVLQSLAAGKHVFVEKPMCMTSQEGQQIVAMARERGLIVRVGFNRRFSPHLNMMKRAIGAHGPRMLLCRVSIGSIEGDSSNTEREGGRVLGEAVHFFDLCNWFFNSAPISLSSVVAGEKKRTNPNIVCQLQYPSGGAAQILYTSVGSADIGKEYFEAHGNGRSVVVDDYREVRISGGEKSAARVPKGDKGHLAELEEFACAVRGQPHAIAGADASAGLAATEMALAVYGANDAH